jgi:hypothetical protein
VKRLEGSIGLAVLVAFLVALALYLSLSGDW